MIKRIAAVCAALLVSASFAHAVTLNADRIISSGSTPVLTACGTAPSIVGGDTAGVVTMGTGTPTGCVITFATPYVGVPFCLVVWQGTPLAAQNYTVSATAITTVQTATSSNLLDYICIARTGG